MTALKPFFLAAKGASTIVATLVGQTVASDGTFSDGTSGSIKGQFKRIRVTSSPTKDNVSSNDSPRANNLTLEDNLRCEFEEMQVKGVAGQVLSVLVANFAYVKVTFAYANKTYGPIYLSLGEYTDGIESKGNGTLTLSGDLVDVGQSAVLPYAEA